MRRPCLGNVTGGIGLQIFPRIVVGVLYNPTTTTLFTPSERVEMLRELYEERPRVEIQLFSGLLVKLLQDLGARVIIRGMRAVSDFEYEFQMALMNRRLHPEAETVFLTPKEARTHKISIPRTLTGHIDIIQVRGKKIRIMDYKPDAISERQTEKQLTLYALALGRRTEIPLSKITCSYFDENGYFQFKPIY